LMPFRPMPDPTRKATKPTRSGGNTACKNLSKVMCLRHLSRGSNFSDVITRLGLQTLVVRTEDGRDREKTPSEGGFCRARGLVASQTNSLAFEENVRKEVLVHSQCLQPQSPKHRQLMSRR
jgi:hypothetical protein